MCLQMILIFNKLLDVEVICTFNFGTANHASNSELFYVFEEHRSWGREYPHKPNKFNAVKIQANSTRRSVLWVCWL